MFLIDDDEPQFLPRQEQRRARPNDDPRRAIGNAPPHPLALARAHIRMPLRRIAAESIFDTRQKRLRECYLRQQQQHLGSRRQCRRHRFEIDFRLARSGDAIEQHHLVRPRRHHGAECRRRCLLVL